ncbi:30S ribosomal protein S9 [Conexibacter stalactiti]|uniref:30S ribosomal protein S9 n=1 Tax=Conexibacter stalactiti TaxID=1940611 RepID=UPI00384F82BF
MSDVEQPEDEQRNPAGETPEEPVEAASEAPEPAAEGEQPAAEQPAAEQPAAEEPAADEAAEQPVAESGDDEAAEEEIPETPRVKPEIPGADLVPDIVLDGEAREEDEDEDGETTASADSDSDEEQEAQPIADAAISLASGARYTATGKRKTAVARVILKPGTGEYTINGKPLNDFFPRPTLQRNIRQPLEAVGYEERMDVIAKMHGGGVSAQAGALRHGISRALLQADPNLRGELKKRGFLTRDPRVKERKKAGLKKARKRPQFSKR